MRTTLDAGSARRWPREPPMLPSRQTFPKRNSWRIAAGILRGPEAWCEARNTMPQAGARSFFGRAVGGEPGGGEAERNRGGGFRLPAGRAG